MLNATSVSVIIPVWNRAGIVGRSIDSILTQQGSFDIEIIVVDDGSTDDLDSALWRYGARVTTIRHVYNLGAAAARNTGVAAASGAMLAFLDSDDIWLPGKLSAQLEFMRQRGFRASCTAYHLVGRNRAEIVSPRFDRPRMTMSDMIWGCFIGPGSTLVCEKTLFAEVGPLDTALKRLEDWDWLLRFCELGHTMGFLGTPMARIEVLGKSDHNKTLSALSVIQDRHAGCLSGQDRRRFEAAIEFERAATNFRWGKTLRALPALARSMWLSPRDHQAFAAAFHNLFSRR